MKDKVAIVFYGYPVGVSVMIINTARMFAEKGFDVDIFQTRVGLEYSSVEFKEKNIRYISIDGNEAGGQDEAAGTPGQKKSFRKKIKNNVAFIVRFIYYLLNPLLISFPALHYKLVRYCKPDFLKYMNKISRYKDDSYKYILGIEIFGLYAANVLKSSPHQKIIYLNMELFKLSTSRSRDRYFKSALETFVLRRNADHIVIANKERIKVFLDDKKYIEPSRVEMLPVASLGEPYLEKGNYFREKFNIPESKKIVLYSGNIIEWAMCLEIVESVKNWPEEYVLVLHSYIENPENKEYVEQIKNKVIPGRIFISQKHFSFWELDKILSSGDVGLLFYREKDENFTEIGFSSNKLTQYLKTGLPLITNDLPFFRGFFAEYKCGKIVSSFEDISGALTGILNDYDSFRENAIHCYEEHFNFRKYFDVFLENISRN